MGTLLMIVIFNYCDSILMLFFLHCGCSCIFKPTLINISFSSHGSRDGNVSLLVGPFLQTGISQKYGWIAMHFCSDSHIPF